MCIRDRDKLDQMGIVHTCFYDVEPDPSLASARAGAAATVSYTHLDVYKRQFPYRLLSIHKQ